MKTQVSCQTVAFVLLAALYLPCQSEEQQSTTLLSPSPSLYPLNLSSNNASVLLVNATIQTVLNCHRSLFLDVNFTVNTSSVLNPNRSSSAITNKSASIISQISGSTRTENNTFFVEFKAEALTWSPDLTKEYHNTFIHTANKIVGIVDNLYANVSFFKGSFVIGFREGGYVSTKLQFNGGDINNLDILIHYLRDGGGELLTDKVYLKVGKIADCIIAYIDTTLCDCISMSYRRQITCRQPEIHGGEDCPKLCYTGQLIAGSKSCSWDDLDAFKCAASREKPFEIIFSLIYITVLMYICSRNP